MVLFVMAFSCHSIRTILLLIVSSFALDHSAYALRRAVRAGFWQRHSYYCDECGPQLAPWIRRKVQAVSAAFSERIGRRLDGAHGHTAVMLTVSRWGRVVHTKNILESRDPKSDAAACGDALRLETDPLPAAYPKDFLSLVWVCWYGEEPYDIFSDATGAEMVRYMRQSFVELAMDPRSAVHSERLAMAFHRAAADGDVVAIGKLLDEGAAPDAPAPGGVTALMEASATSQVETAKLLIEGGANVNAEREKGRTALMLASAVGDARMVRLLLRAGAERELKSDGGWTARSLAEIYGHDDVRALLGDDSPSPTARRFENLSTSASSAVDSERPRLKEQAPAAYTADALRRHISGKVVLGAIVLANGHVGAVWVRQSLDIGLDLNAVESVRQWRFSPATLGGRAVAQPIDVEVVFSPPGASP